MTIGYLAEVVSLPLGPRALAKYDHTEKPNHGRLMMNVTKELSASLPGSSVCPMTILAEPRHLSSCRLDILRH